MLNGLSRVAAYLEDIILTGSSQEELLHRFHCVLERIRQYGFRLRAEKCAFFSHPPNILDLFLTKMVVIQTEEIFLPYNKCQHRRI
ncbi:hypothetical protein CLF_104554 [Clonorchis sinensis]|uniref:Reverse transcriptase domain-containing protein n=1 Tax=Clonorchis sinensis TaxID=79923 RepID=G7YBW5_CLOSI|nr:hypothetical protein CLF_104554 [Clonorchis sinensis]